MNEFIILVHLTTAITPTTTKCLTHTRLHGFTDDSGHECLKNVNSKFVCVREREREKMTISKSENLVLYSMILLGLGYLAPYNSVLTAVDYFTDKFGSDIEYYVAAALQ